MRRVFSSLPKPSTDSLTTYHLIDSKSRLFVLLKHFYRHDPTYSWDLGLPGDLTIPSFYNERTGGGIPSVTAILPMQAFSISGLSRHGGSKGGFGILTCSAFISLPPPSNSFHAGTGRTSLYC